MFRFELLDGNKFFSVVIFFQGIVGCTPIPTWAPYGQSLKKNSPKKVVAIYGLKIPQESPFVQPQLPWVHPSCPWESLLPRRKTTAIFLQVFSAILISPATAASDWVWPRSWTVIFAAIHWFMPWFMAFWGRIGDCYIVKPNKILWFNYPLPTVGIERTGGVVWSQKVANRPEVALGSQP